VFSGKRKQRAVTAISNRFLEFVSGEHKHRDTQRVIIALPPLSRYFLTFASTLVGKTEERKTCKGRGK